MSASKKYCYWLRLQVLAACIAIAAVHTLFS